MQFVMTSGQRLEYLVQTMDSLIENVEGFLDLDAHILSIDSIKFEHERDAIKEKYSFIDEFINVRGLMHWDTLNKLWFEVADSDYIFHNEDDRVVIEKDDYIKKAQQVLNNGEHQEATIAATPQYFGKEIEINGTKYLEWIHDKEKTDEMFKSKNWQGLGPYSNSQPELWPSFTLSTSFVNRKWFVERELRFPQQHHFERRFGFLACDKGFKRVSFERVRQSHIGAPNSLYKQLGRQR